MARGRFISKDISWDEKVEALSDDSARLLFTWMIAHLDREGRIEGEPHLIKAKVLPHRRWSDKKTEKYLNEMEKLNLILRYSVNGTRFIFAYNFEKHQPGLQKDREAQSRIPPPNSRVSPGLLQGYSNKTLTEVEVEVKGKVKVEEEGTSPSQPPRQPHHIQYLSKLKGWKSALDEDEEWLKEFLAEFPDYSVLELKTCLDFYSGRPAPKHKGIWKNRFRNWMIKKKEFESDRGKSTQGKKRGRLPSQEELIQQAKDRGIE